VVVYFKHVFLIGCQLNDFILFGNPQISLKDVSLLQNLATT